MTKILAILLAAGRGRRAGGGLPKTYRKISGQVVLRQALDAFINHPAITTIQPVIHPDDAALFEPISQGLALAPPVFGGETRADSVKAALEAHQGFDYVLIHDGARPFVSAKIIDDVIAALANHQGAIAAIPVSDALWQTEGSSLQTPIPRESLIAAQTPQGFHFEPYKALAQGGLALDDAQTAMQSGLDVVWVMGDKHNQKLTYQEDFEA